MRRSPRSTTDGYVTLVSGPLDEQGTACLQEASADRGPHAVLLDLGDDGVPGPVGLELLVTCDAELRRRGGVLVVVTGHDRSRRSCAARDLQVSPALPDGLATAGRLLDRRSAA